MQIRLLVKMVGHHGKDHFAAQPGAVLDLPEARANKLCAHGHAMSDTSQATYDLFVKIQNDKIAQRINPSRIIQP